MKWIFAQFCRNNETIGFRFRVQRLIPKSTAHHINQNPEYPIYNIGWNGLISTVKTDLFDEICLGIFQPWTFNPEPLNLDHNFLLINQSTNQLIIQSTNQRSYSFLPQYGQ
jgi:hypothetical protein